ASGLELKEGRAADGTRRQDPSGFPAGQGGGHRRMVEVVLDVAGHLRPGLLRDRDDGSGHLPLRHLPVRHGGLPGFPAPGGPAHHRRPGQPQDGPGDAHRVRPDGRPQVGHRHGRVRFLRRNVQQLRDRAGCGPRTAGGHLPARLPAPPGNADQRDPSAAQRDRQGRSPRRQPGRGAPTGGGSGPGRDPHPPDEGSADVSEKDERTPDEHASGKDENAPATEPATQEEAGAQVQPAGRTPLDVVAVRSGMFGVDGSGDTSGYGGLERVETMPGPSPRPYGGYFDEIVDVLAEVLAEAGVDFEAAVEKVVVQHEQLWIYVAREHLPLVAASMRDDPDLRFEFCIGVSGVHYPDDTGRELHAVYPLFSITHNRMVHLEVTAPDADPHIPTIIDTYPAND